MHPLAPPTSITVYSVYYALTARLTPLIHREYLAPPTKLVGETSLDNC